MLGTSAVRVSNRERIPLDMPQARGSDEMKDWKLIAACIGFVACFGFGAIMYRSCAPVTSTIVHDDSLVFKRDTIILSDAVIRYVPKYVTLQTVVIDTAQANYYRQQAWDALQQLALYETMTADKDTTVLTYAELITGTSSKQISFFQDLGIRYSFPPQNTFELIRTSDPIILIDSTQICTVQESGSWLTDALEITLGILAGLIAGLLITK
jgi:hypothetical protein